MAIKQAIALNRNARSQGTLPRVLKQQGRATHLVLAKTSAMSVLTKSTTPATAPMRRNLMSGSSACLPAHGELRIAVAVAVAVHQGMLSGWAVPDPPDT